MSATADTSANAPHFQQRLGLFDATSLVMGTMIGSGIFVTSAEIAANVGSAGWLMAIWVLAGVMTVLGALSYSELAAMYPKAGGQYIFLKEAYSPLWGFLYGWTCFLVIQTGSIAAVAVVFAKFLGVFVPALGTDHGIAMDGALAAAVPHVQGFFPNLGWAPDQVHATVIYAATHVNWTMSLPIMGPFFEMKHFIVTGGQIVALLVIAFLTWLNCRGVQEGKVVQNVMTIIKTLALLMLIVIGIFVVSKLSVREVNWADAWGGMFTTEKFAKSTKLFGNLNPQLLAIMIFGGAMVGALFSADAWNNITFAAGEIRNPKRNLPMSLALGTGTVVLLYVAANLAYVEALPVRGNLEAATKLEAESVQLERDAQKLVDQGKINEAGELRDKANQKLSEAARARGIDNARDGRVGTAVLELVSPRWGAPIMAIAIMISTFGCVNGMTLMGARLYYVMAKEGLFFRSVGTLNKHGVPAAALVVQGIWSTLLLFSGTYDDLLDYVIFAVLIFYVLTVIGLFILRRKQPNLERPVKAFGYPVLPALYVILCAAVMIDLLLVKPKMTWPGLIIVLAGIPVYFLWRAVGKKAA
ncbi:MAG TPA: amino acid permease [Gemmatales bacterium]|nr:amino acid permease [Gemmatales bacterium]